MKLSIQREVLLKPLQLAASIAERRPSLPILANVMLHASPDSLTIIGSDSEIELVGKIPLEERAHSGSITVPARKFLDICKSLPDYSVLELELVQPTTAHKTAPMEETALMQQLQIRCGRSKFLLATLPAEDFPITQESTPTGQLSIPQGLLSDLLKQTYFAMAQQDVRHYLNGALFELTPNQLTVVAADGHRLALSRIAMESEHQAQLIVPRKAVLELLKLLDHTSQVMAELVLSDNQMRVITPDYVLTTKIIDSKFPDYNRVIPVNGDKIIELDRDVFKQTLARTSILAHEKHRGIRLGLQSDNLRISTHNPEQEQAEEELEISYGGEELEIGFNVSYLIDVLNTIPSGKVELTLIDGNSSALLKGQDSAQQSGIESLYVVMPLRL